jgi:hypothetical protein
LSQIHLDAGQDLCKSLATPLNPQNFTQAKIKVYKAEAQKKTNANKNNDNHKPSQDVTSLFSAFVYEESLRQPRF